MFFEKNSQKSVPLVVLCTISWSCNPTTSGDSRLGTTTIEEGQQMLKHLNHMQKHLLETIAFSPCVYRLPLLLLLSDSSAISSLIARAPFKGRGSVHIEPIADYHYWTICKATFCCKRGTLCCTWFIWSFRAHKELSGTITYGTLNLTAPIPPYISPLKHNWSVHMPKYSQHKAANTHSTQLNFWNSL